VAGEAGPGLEDGSGQVADRLVDTEAVEDRKRVRKHRFADMESRMALVFEQRRLDPAAGEHDARRASRRAASQDQNIGRLRNVHAGR
jgi:hypothetical protein